MKTLCRLLVLGSTFVGCHQARTPMMQPSVLVPREVGTVTGTIGIGTKGAEPVRHDVRECHLRRTTSRDGVAYAVDFLAPTAKYTLIFDQATDGASLAVLDDGSGKKPLVLPKSACVDQAINFFERHSVVHGSVRLDCEVEATRVVVAASFDNCEG